MHRKPTKKNWLHCHSEDKIHVNSKIQASIQKARPGEKLAEHWNASESSMRDRSPLLPTLWPSATNSQTSYQRNPQSNTKFHTMGNDMKKTDSRHSHTCQSTYIPYLYFRKDLHTTTWHHPHLYRDDGGLRLQDACHKIIRRVRKSANVSHLRCLSVYPV